MVKDCYNYRFDTWDRGVGGVGIFRAQEELMRESFSVDM